MLTLSQQFGKQQGPDARIKRLCRETLELICFDPNAPDAAHCPRVVRLLCGKPDTCRERDKGKQKSPPVTPGGLLAGSEDGPGSARPGNWSEGNIAVCLAQSSESFFPNVLDPL